VRVEVLTESRANLLTLTRSEANAITRLGYSLASDTTWWGDSEAEIERTVIECSHVERDLWRVTVRNAIGIIVVGGSLQLRVDPKIDFDHFIYLSQVAGILPRMEHTRGLSHAARSLWDLVAEWYVTECERVIRRELLRDYEELRDTLTTVRGTIAVRETGSAFYAGRPVVVCEFDEFTMDTPLNRVLKVAARTVASATILRESLRRRAQRIVLRMEDVSDIRPGDDRAFVERRTAHYTDALMLARHILRGVGRSLETGSERVWTFLIRTPAVIEEGLRRIVQRRFGRESVRRRRMQLLGSTLTLNPDLVIEEEGSAVATADVKYKIAAGEWKRNDLYQAVTFATGFGVKSAAICEFRPLDVAPLDSVGVGAVRVSHLTWPLGAELSAEAAEGDFLSGFELWLRYISASHLM
jgi:5-methylcytosine-specific restriction enzyme subunit McrC